MRARRSPRVESRFFAPPQEFDGCFTTFYQLKLDVPEGLSVRDALQPEWANIRFFAGGRPNAQIGDSSVRQARFSATGPSSLPCSFELGSARMWGIGFLPLGWARFFDRNACDLVNLVVDGEAHPAFRRFGGLAKTLCDPETSDEEQFDAIVATMREHHRPSRDDDKILSVHRALVDEDLSRVAELAERADIGVRTLERICRRYFGFTPRLLMRRQRFMRSLTTFMLQDDVRWTDAMDEHYHDQAQFTREFRQFMTMKPSEYAAMDHPILTSFVEARARMWGSAAQTLDKPN